MPTDPAAVHALVPDPVLPPSITDHATLERAAARAEHVRAVVDLFPPLTPEQRDRIAVLLRPR